MALKVRTREFSLIIATTHSNNFFGGWAVGSIPAHYIHLKKHGKVFWYQGIDKKGFGNYNFENKDDWKFLKRNPGKTKRSIILSKLGFFYEPINQITWQFKLEKVVKRNEISREEKKYIPRFREIYNNKEHVGDWILLSDIKKIREPLQFIGGKEFRVFSKRGNKVFPRILRNMYFACHFPRLSSNKLLAPDCKELLDLYLKQFLLKGSKDKKFREQNVQDALLVALLSQGLNFSKEGVVNNDNNKGRYDFLFKKGRRYYAVEIKANDDENAPEQLKNYISVLKKERKLKNRNITGIVICGKPSEKTRKNAEKFGYAVKEYRLNIDFPGLFN